MKYKLNTSLITIEFFLCFISFRVLGDDIKTLGKATFISHCSSCHQIGSVLIGPDLANLNKRRSLEWIIHFVQSSQNVIKKGDKDAVLLFNKYKIIMPDQPDLKEDDIKNVMAYIGSKIVIAPVDKSFLITPYLEKANYLPLNNNNYGFIICFLLLVVTLVVTLFFAVNVNILNRNLGRKD